MVKNKITVRKIYRNKIGEKNFVCRKSLNACKALGSQIKLKQENILQISLLFPVFQNEKNTFL